MFLFKNRKHEVTQQSVQAALLLSHPTITGLMKRLEAKGFITRKNSPADFRCKYVKLTKKGCDIERGLKTNMKRMQVRRNWITLKSRFASLQRTTVKKKICSQQNALFKTSKNEQKRKKRKKKTDFFSLLQQ